ncbi:MAG: hypothetical protein ACD_17C00070G0001 [uncultured bacterium]|nr:MAG: hypothetical protein ACD_17C00070G0001 [uncultured bacterium]OGN55451.1 MAG: xylose isomerase [Chlamydiae bacterium RIFCSPHIGHO2_01_FULL_44_39]OGN57595.1 MAG: xylose isomerase [Chlamydiae bacterium RIFCSPHIGHO2_02_FULL_45_9]OGN59954.1 MAG: xylose isomerase [Chlamydiae bacterium RIFCSPHIGHO2_12_FULL_44_59]OGN66169.1 MAG: xylose isomerase [Chlamydiae bacterium RIFCSPLOWO2_01_FULL_44_52]OGN69073.1 MAG: xylose isomerase [Chlamydiae bacterium RIFCSPLOWO2_02_FULL_45_22]OGN69904.1 MAG: xylos
MKEYFPKLHAIPYEGPNSKKHLSFRYYDAKKKILGKSMEEHLRIAVCFWHSFSWLGSDMFGMNTFERPWMREKDPMKAALQKIEAGFEFLDKLGVKYFCFHDRDVAPEGKTFRETKKNLERIKDKMQEEMARTKKELLWGTANLFSHPRYMAGASTNPDPEVFAYAAAQVKLAMDVTHELKGQNYVFWGGREGYDTLLNTDLVREENQFARFLHMAADYKEKIGFQGTLLIEPKPREPSTHQYDYDSATVFAFLQKYGLEKKFKVNIEGNHATLAGHSFAHEIAYAIANGIFGSIDANQGDPQLGWDTDQFPHNLQEFTYAIYLILKGGGFRTGGLNLDTKLRRQSIDLEDLFHAHICGIDTLARALIAAIELYKKDPFGKFQKARYADWKRKLGKSILSGKVDFPHLSTTVISRNIEPRGVSGKQELLENILNQAIQ